MNKTRTANFLNGFDIIAQKAYLMGVQTRVQLVHEGKILAYKKNKSCLIRIFYIKNTNEECFIGIYIKLMHVTFYPCFDKLLMSF